MERYKNTASVPLTFHGVTFQPGEEKEVKGYINHRRMVRVTGKPAVKKAVAPKKQPVQKVAQPEPNHSKVSTEDVASPTEKVATAPTTDTNTTVKEEIVDG